ncbi:MAG: methyl-accepting chemotaxis protein [Clostridia bacterium]|nr:methyl-accepting chemotaxis protein [Clostridia bacterium]MDD4048053.1 methyl-accepting chemotaxis protein [Clostridia bacterium]
MQEFTLVDHLLKVAPIINQFTQADMGIVICDSEKWISYKPANTLDIRINIGDIVPKNSVAFEAMKTKKRIIKEVDESECGTNYIAVGVPLMDEDRNILGAAMCFEKVEHRDILVSIAKEISKYLKNFQGTVQEISAEAQELSATSDELQTATEDATVKVESTSGILDTVKQIAKRTNLIGLNASIEAARVGKYGRGFTVVANEVRNLSQMTNKSTGEIGDIVSSIKDTINSINIAMKMVNEVSRSQAEKLSGINGILDEFSSLTEKLVQEADRYLKED